MPKYVITGASRPDTVELKLENDDDCDPTLYARRSDGEWVPLLWFADDGSVYRRDVEDSALRELLQFTEEEITVH